MCDMHEPRALELEPRRTKKRNEALNTRLEEEWKSATSKTERTNGVSQLVP